ncbi:low molecular weight protein-tyrosine-phosphatase [Alteromonas oceanisediminis]|uniref:low molecular weight protein-tyrosine-phosphatase n=1 Tax=Alteromonas oceanisediminis TaxID=2836180 RepID=UPI001BD9DA7B|nr:low molecular weight protein-tyrosine-phosphatase [Alteromonas oceanisediminis]MBT0587634.1 low molecular weight phosphotyrosine protein phosphatase [Alteromonas oceanisediminis]
MPSPVSVLFVCLGNICRSPTAEAVFRHKAKALGVEVHIDSAGTHGYHIGKAPDKRSQDAGTSRGYDFSGLACRRVDDSDYEKFDYIVCMDHENMQNLKERCPPEHQHKLHLFLNFADSEFDEVPDPYYGGKRGFDLVLDLIEQSSDGLLAKLRE